MNETAAPPYTCSCSRAREVLSSLRHAGAAVEARLERCLEPWGLSLAKMGALDTLMTAGGPLPLGQLAERLCCVKSNVTQLVDRLEAEGLVRRVPDPEDRRSVLAVVTDEGRERFAQAAEARARVEQELLAQLVEDELERLQEMIRKVVPRGI